MGIISKFGRMIKNFFAVLVLLISVLSAQSSDSIQIDESHFSSDSSLKLFRKSLADSNISYSSKIELIEQAIEYLKVHDNVLWYDRFMVRKVSFLRGNKEYLRAIKYGMQLINDSKERTVKKSPLANMLMNISVSYEELGLEVEAIHYRRQQISFYDPNIHRIAQSNAYNAIGRMYLKSMNFDSALYFFRYSYDYQSKFKKRRGSAGALNDIGWTYFEQRNFDSAEVHFLKAMELYEMGDTSTDSLMVGIVGGNISQCLSIKGNKERIKRLLNLKIQRTRKYEEFNSLVRAYFVMGNLYYEIGEMRMSKVYLDSSYALNVSLDSTLEVMDDRRNIYEAYIQIFQAQNDLKSELKYTQLLFALNESIYGKSRMDELIATISQFKVSGYRSRLEMERRELASTKRSLLLAEEKRALEKSRFNLYIVVGLLALVLLLFLLYKFKSDQKKLVEIQDLKERYLEASIKTKTKRLTQAAIGLSRKSEFAKQVIDMVSSIKGVSTSDISPIKVFIHNEIQMDTDMVEMEKYVEDLSKDFFVKLKIKHPELNKNEVKLCALIRLKLSNKEVAVIRNITSDSVKVAKNRLSRKLDLTKGTPLLDYLISLE